jgi:hypothetical protein
MFWSGKFVGVVVFGIAISLCLTVCSMPEIFAQKTTAGHCHTDQQEEEEQNDSQMRCCNRESTLPPSYTCIVPETDQAMLPEESFSAESSAFERVIVPARLLDASSPPLATILRI